MLLLVFQLGASRFALDARAIVEVVPLMKLEPIAHAPAYVAGLFNYRGELVPVIDLRQLTRDQPCSPHMTSRIMLVNYPLPGGRQRLLGLLAEQVTETIKREREAFTANGIHIHDTPYLGDIAQDEQGMIHFLQFEQLLPAAVCELLFSPDAA
jgi:chemotaxis-related protein WspB